MESFFKQVSEVLELCFYVDTTSPLDVSELEVLRWILSETFEPEKFAGQTLLIQGREETIELGPRLNFETAYSTNLVGICHSCGLRKIRRIECSKRHILPANADRQTFISQNHDRMTECLYPKPLTSFETGSIPEPVYEVPVIERGIEAFNDIPGLAMDEWDKELYYTYFVGHEKRNPTIVEIRDLDNANSEHSRHGFFKGRQIIDGRAMPETLLEIVKSTLMANPGNSVLSFRDNSSAIRGSTLWTIMPEYPGRTSAFVKTRVTYHIIFTAETHNFPTGVAPFPGAETGTGGRIRDVNATGRGAFVIAGTAGYCVGNLLIPGFVLPWEDESLEYPSSLASPLQIEIRASDGASDYGNKFGEPVIQGFTRSYDQILPSGERVGFVKPIMFTGGVGQISAEHVEKERPSEEMLIVQIGGPAYGIGIGGGSASSMLQGENEEELDFNAVQRGDPETEQKANRAIRACAEMGGGNPIVSIHDQGAGGPANVLKELVEGAGGEIDIRKIRLGDLTLSVLEIWIAEYQERWGLLIHPGRISEFKSICEREKVHCEILGRVTGDGRFVVQDSQNGTTPVSLDLDRVLGNMPQKTFQDNTVEPTLKALDLPPDMTIENALRLVLRDLSVGSKGFLTNKVDRSVTGLIAQQQCCGPLQLTVADVGVIAQSHFGFTGAAISIGEQPIKMLINPGAGARMAVGEALTNIVWAEVEGLQYIKCSANWMWAPKLPGEGAAIYSAASAMRDLMVDLGIAVDGGKDSLSMATVIGNSVVKSPRQLVISAYATVPDIRKVVTPDIKKPGQSTLVLIDISGGKNRLGGSALAHVHKQLGNESPDVDDPQVLKSAFKAVQELMGKELILAGHDVSDGGLIVTLLEMAFSGNCGIRAEVRGTGNETERLFAEELGLVFECYSQHLEEVISVLTSYNLPLEIIGQTTEERSVVVTYNSREVLRKPMPELRSWWQETSYQIDRLQANPACVDEERKNTYDLDAPRYHLSFKPKPTPGLLVESKPRVAIIREEGSNGDREMTSAFQEAGFIPHDVTMTDILKGEATLENFRGIVAVGGFSYADVPESAKGWASVIRFNERLKRMFEDFRNRPDTFSLGVCNGCQLLALLGWVPWLGILDEKQPRFIRNTSGRFESRWVTLRILNSPALMLKEMEGSVMPAWVAHGEGRLFFPDEKIAESVTSKSLAPVVYVDNHGDVTEKYPSNPNGSVNGIAALCSDDGRHLAMMPHPERVFLPWQWSWMPNDWKKMEVSPWLQMFQNARAWCE